MPVRLEPDCRPADPDRATDSVIWLSPDAPAGAVADVQALLDGHPAVGDHRYVDRDETYAEFQAYYHDEPKILALVEPTQFPTSYRVVFTTVAGGLVIEDEQGRLPGVEQVEFPAEVQCRRGSD